MRNGLAFVAFAALAWLGYAKYGAAPPETHARVEFTAPAPVPATAAPARFNCDGRTRCTQMTSCEEATYFLQHCPNTTMDGDHDGVPCEKQWCH
jgi:hypothetical protein